MSIVDTVRPSLVTREKAIEAFKTWKGAKPAGPLRVLRYLMDENGWDTCDLDTAAGWSVIALAFHEIYGTYVFVGPRGGISQRRYVGIQAARENARRYSPRAQLVMLVGGHEEKIEGESELAARLMETFSNE